MPVKTVARNGLYRVIAADSGRIAKTALGNARDGGGHATKDKAASQARAINAAIARKG